MRKHKYPLKRSGNKTGPKIEDLNAILQKANRIHENKYGYSQVVFKDRYTKVDIVCPVHGVFRQSFHNHVTFRRGCQQCGVESSAAKRLKGNIDFINDSKLIHGDRFGYTKVDYHGNKYAVIITCKHHGDFLQSPTSHLAGNGCRQCSNEEASKRYRLTNEEFISRSSILHNHIYDYSLTEYGNNSDEKVAIVCKIHGVFYQTPHDHLSGRGCKKCYLMRINSDKRHDLDKFIQKCISLHGNTYDYSLVVYKNDKTKVEIICKKHGPFWCKPNSHLNNLNGCPRCRSSKGEIAIKRILQRNHIQFQEQYRMPESDVRFRYDFYLPEHRILIEFQGEQHYRPMGYMGGEESLKDVIRRDALKKDIALTIVYTIVYFDYKQLRLEAQDFEQIVLNTLKHFIVKNQRRSINGSYGN